MCDGLGSSSFLSEAAATVDKPFGEYANAVNPSVPAFALKLPTGATIFSAWFRAEAPYRRQPTEFLAGYIVAPVS